MNAVEVKAVVQQPFLADEAKQMDPGDQVLASQAGKVYEMVTAKMVKGEIEFPSDKAFNEAMRVGFFRIKTPEKLIDNIQAGRDFAKTLSTNKFYQQKGEIDEVNGYLTSKFAQTVRFTLDRDNWNKCHVAGKEVKGPANYPEKLQQLGEGLHQIGLKVLTKILEKKGLPEKKWFEATAGAAEGEGSLFLLFNCYDPKNSEKPDGVGEHKDWSYVTVLDAYQEGLEAEIDGKWRPLRPEDGYLTINFGYALEKLFPKDDKDPSKGVTASNHRVVTQKKIMRTSTAVFIDPRVGPYRESVPEQWKGKEGVVYDLDPKTCKLYNGETAVSFFDRLDKLLYG